MCGTRAHYAVQLSLIIANESYSTRQANSAVTSESSPSGSTSGSDTRDSSLWPPQDGWVSNAKLSSSDVMLRMQMISAMFWKRAPMHKNHID